MSYLIIDKSSLVCHRSTELYGDDLDVEDTDVYGRTLCNLTHFDALIAEENEKTINDVVQKYKARLCEECFDKFERTVIENN